MADQSELDLQAAIERLDGTFMRRGAGQRARLRRFPVTTQPHFAMLGAVNVLESRISASC